MKSAIKAILSLSLIIVFLILCIGVLATGYTGLWLHTYNVFTQKTRVADIELSELKTDQTGEYVNVKVTEYSYGTGLETLFNLTPVREAKGEYKVYGDTIYIGGPIVKFKDELIFFNFKTMYKLSKLYGRYSDNTKETNKPIEAQKQSSYDVNGGYADWKSMFENYRADGLLGQFYRLFIDATQLSEPGQFASNKPLQYELFITNTGFLWEIKN